MACEALEVVGRCRRPTDLDAAETAFTRALEVAARHGLGPWRLRALYELGVVDLLRDARLSRLLEARDAAIAMGAPATEAAIELHLCAGLFLRGDDDVACADSAARTVALARRLGLGHVLAAALGFRAMLHARAGEHAAMERVLSEAEGYADGDASFPATAACARAMAAFVRDDRAAALAHLDPYAQRDSAQIRSQDPAGAWWALLRAVDPDGAAAAADARCGGTPVNVITRGFLSLADAVVRGRTGDRAGAQRAVAQGQALLAELGWMWHFGMRWVSEAALRDCWGEPERWLREAGAFFREAGQERLAAACRTLLRRAGVPVPRTRDVSVGLPDPLSRAGVTGREYEVLRLLAEGMPNARIAERLYLSPRTVERHIANVCSKVGLKRRAELVALAARTLA